MNRAAIAFAGLVALTLPALAQTEPVTPVNPAKFRHLSCDEIARRIGILNGAIGDNNSTIAGFGRTQDLGKAVEFFLLGLGSRTPEYNAKIASARGERNALIAVAVEKNCAAKRPLLKY